MDDNLFVDVRESELLRIL